MLRKFLTALANINRPKRAERHAEWDAEVQLEIARTVAEREKRSLAANLIGWAACVAAALGMPNGEIFAIPIAWRLFSIFYVRFAWARFRKTLANFEPHEDALSLARFSLAVSAIFWALLLVPIASGMAFHALAFVILTVTTIGVSLVCTMLGPMPRLMMTYYSIFMITVISCVFLGAGNFDLWVPLFVVTAGFGILAYALGAGRENRATAETIVENRRLGYELTRALKRAEDLAKRDPLTGLMNRRAFFESVNADDNVEAGTRHLLTIDLDHFKSINDNFGHEAGDKVLIATADQIRTTLRALPGRGHFSCRFGGEEFVVLVKGLDPLTAQTVAEALRNRIRQIAGLLSGTDGVKISASIGVAQMADDETIDEALRRSDLAMYRAKDRGRDRIELAA